MFALEVTEELESWPEKENHDRKWVSMLLLTETKGTDYLSQLQPHSSYH